LTFVFPFPFLKAQNENGFDLRCCFFLFECAIRKWVNGFYFRLPFLFIDAASQTECSRIALSAHEFICANMSSILDSYVEDIRRLLDEGKTYEEISDYLKSIGLIRGGSVANIRKYSRELGINRRCSTVSTDELDTTVANAIQQVS